MKSFTAGFAKISIGVLLLSQGAFAKSDVEDKIQHIKALYNELQKAPLKSISHDEACGSESAEGSSSKVFLQGDEIKIIKDEYYGEMGKEFYIFYYENGKPFFILETEYLYSTPLMQPIPNMPKPTQTITEYRYYIDDAKLLRLLEAKKELQPQAPKFSQKWPGANELATKSYACSKEYLKTEKKTDK